MSTKILNVKKKPPTSCNTITLGSIYLGNFEDLENSFKAKENKIQQKLKGIKEKKPFIFKIKTHLQ